MRNTILLLSGLGVIAMGCNEYEIVDNDKFEEYDGEDAVPDIRVDPEALAFGSLNVFEDEAAAASVTEIVNVYNDGVGDLHIDEIVLSNEDGIEFELSAITSVLIQEGGSAQFTVTFTPQTATDYNNSVLIYSDDPNESTVEIPLTGTGIAPVIDVSPVEYDFGTLYIGCDSEQAFTISNIELALQVVTI